MTDAEDSSQQLRPRAAAHMGWGPHYPSLVHCGFNAHCASVVEQASEMLEPAQSSHTLSSKGCSQIKETKATLIPETTALPMLCSRRPCADSSHGGWSLWPPGAVHRTLMMVSIILLALTPDSWVIYQGNHLNANPCLSQGSAYGEP